MQKPILLAFMVLMAAGGVFAKDNLAILPFTGGQGDEGEAIAELLSFNDRLNGVFTPIPRTSITRAMAQEQDFQQLSTLTKWDTYAAIGEQLGAQYVMAGNITAVGASKLLVVAILKIDTLQQIAGDVVTYTNIEEIRGKLPQTADNVITAIRDSSSTLDKLAVVPVQLQGGGDEQTADTLAQILAIHLIRSGTYTVYPRTKSLEQVQDEYDNQQAQAAADAAAAAGQGENPHLVLAVVARSLGNVNMFNASIIDLVDGTQAIGRSAEYSGIEDGMRAMESLARALTGTEEAPPVRVTKPEFSSGRRLGAGVLNLALGLGSLTMKDWGGGFGLLAGHAVGWGLFIYDVAALEYDHILAGVLAPVGLGVVGVSAVYGFIRPFIYHKSTRVTLTDILDRVHIAIVPDDAAGIRAVGLSYTYRY